MEEIGRARRLENLTDTGIGDLLGRQLGLVVRGRGAARFAVVPELTLHPLRQADLEIEAARNCLPPTTKRPSPNPAQLCYRRPQG
jgi:hypothetical protein